MSYVYITKASWKMKLVTPGFTINFLLGDFEFSPLLMGCTCPCLNKTALLIGEEKTIGFNYFFNCLGFCFVDFASTVFGASHHAFNHISKFEKGTKQMDITWKSSFLF